MDFTYQSASGAIQGHHGPLVLFLSGRKYCEKRRKYCLPAFSPFHTMFTKGFFMRVVESRDRMVKSYIA